MTTKEMKRNTKTETETVNISVNSVRKLSENGSKYLNPNF